MARQTLGNNGPTNSSQQWLDKLLVTMPNKFLATMPNKLFSIIHNKLLASMARWVFGNNGLTNSWRPKLNKLLTTMAWEIKAKQKQTSKLVSLNFVCNIVPHYAVSYSTITTFLNVYFINAPLKDFKVREREKGRDIILTLSWTTR